MEELQAKHRKELKDLQALVTQRKKSASKKTRKGVNDECAKLEAELKERQEQEVAELNGDVPVESRDDVDATETDGDTTDAVTNGVASLSVNGSAAPQQNGKIEGGGGGGGGSKKPNRQKARLARRAASHAPAANGALAGIASLLSCARPSSLTASHRRRCALRRERSRGARSRGHRSGTPCWC